MLGSCFPRRLTGQTSFPVIFQDRFEAGRQLAAKLLPYAAKQPSILALPRGGVPVAFEIARRLQAPLDVFVVRKLGVPGQEELALGAVASGGVCVLSDETIESLEIEQATIDSITRAGLQELQRRENAYREGLPAQDVTGRTVILVDDGLATGSTMYAAVLAMRQKAPQHIVVAVPVAPADTYDSLAREVDAMVCLILPSHFRGVGAWYADFTQVSDEEVRTLLREAHDTNA